MNKSINSSYLTYCKSYSTSISLSISNSNPNSNFKSKPSSKISYNDVVKYCIYNCCCKDIKLLNMMTNMMPLEYIIDDKIA